ncbi:hypothetical protein [Nostoc sp. MG11]|uniref:hypothetical protein n=1 Tax=Nostoc sp. MG11 TaxID=2721166 RepID=UPI0018671917|nr:hypothetical protein [Nostoc sp. MG11]
MLQPDSLKSRGINICELEATFEWLCLDSITYITDCLEACNSADMLADLREIFPRLALKVASVKVHQLQRKRITKWLEELNREV